MSVVALACMGKKESVEGRVDKTERGSKCYRCQFEIMSEISGQRHQVELQEGYMYCSFW